MEHTELPWTQEGLNVCRRGRGTIARIPLPPDGGVMEAVGNAQFIVKACNNHERLLEACQEALKGVEQMLGEDEALPSGSQLAQLYVKLGEAIAKAKGDS